MRGLGRQAGSTRGTGTGRYDEQTTHSMQPTSPPPKARRAEPRHQGWILPQTSLDFGPQNSRKSPKAILRPELEKVLTLGKEKVWPCQVRFAIRLLGTTESWRRPNRPAAIKVNPTPCNERIRSENASFPQRP